MAAKRAAPKPAGFVVSRAMITWIVSIAGGCLLLITAWWQVWDRVEAHWRLESIQKAKDDAADAALKSVASKADADLKAATAKIDNDLAKYKEADRRAGAWTLYTIQDFRAAAEARWAQDCTERKRPADICREIEVRAEQSRKQADQQRATAMDASKGQP